MPQQTMEAILKPVCTPQGEKNQNLRMTSPKQSNKATT